MAKSSLVVGTVVILLLLLLVIGYVCVYVSSVPIWATKASSLIWGFVIAVLVLVALLVLFIGSVFTVRHIEKDNLFQPTVLAHYPGNLDGRWYKLPSGGGLLNTTPARNNAQTRRVFFLHGNSYDLSKYKPALSTLENLGYDVWAIEYAGFGITRPDDGLECPNSESCLQDVTEAWEICGREDAIVIGFSIGGAILGEMYETFDPMPAQLVFLNTFASFPQLVNDKLGTPLLGPFLATQWSTPEPKRYTGKVTVVYTLDDTVVPATHGRKLCQIFQKLNPHCIALKSGGHRYSALNHRDEWANAETLLPAAL